MDVKNILKMKSDMALTIVPNANIDIIATNGIRHFPVLDGDKLHRVIGFAKSLATGPAASSIAPTPWI